MIETSGAFLADVVAGLTAAPKRLPSKYFYDERGSRLFERICELDEYYLTRTELAIMERHVREIARLVGERVLLIEPGSGASVKVRLLLRHLREPAGYVPIDISGEHLADVAAMLRRELPELPIVPVHADFTQDLTLPPMPSAERRVVYFPGSTIGNFEPEAAGALLARMGALAGPGGGLLIGIDMKKDAAVLEAAYNDGEGVTSEFNLNVLRRMRNELGAEVSVEAFDHRAHYNRLEGRIEMHLVSTRPQTIRVDGTVVALDAGETIHTENSYKYDQEQFETLATDAGWTPVARWTDAERRFSVQYCRRDG